MTAPIQTGDQIVATFMIECGGGFPLPMPAEQVAHCARQYLAAYGGMAKSEPMSGAEIAVKLTETDDAGEPKWLGVVEYDEGHGPQYRERIIALECARWIIADQGHDADDRALVEHVASILCGLAKPLVRAAAAAVYATRARAAGER